MSFYRRLSIRKQIFVALVAIVVITTMAFGAVLYAASSRTISQEYEKAHANGIEVAGNLLDSNLRSIIDEERSYLTNTTFLENLARGTAGSRTFPASTNRAIVSQMQKTLFSGTAIRDILVVNTAGNVAFASQNDSNRQYIQRYFHTDSILAQDWVQDAVDARGKEVFYPYNILFTDGGSYADHAEEAFSVVKMLAGRDGNARGFLVFNVRKSYLSSVFGSEDEGYDTSDYLIIDAGRETEDSLSQSDTEEYTDASEESPVLVYSSVPVDTEELRDILDAFRTRDNRSFIFTTRPSGVNRWEVVNVISRKELSSRSSYILLMAVLMMLALIGTSIPLSSYIAGMITRPLQTLEGPIRDVEGGSLKVEAQFDDSEVGRIGSQFKNLVNNNLELKESLLKSEIRERDAQLQLLQSQINPHFLYNTLDALYLMAIIRNEDEIADFVQALSDNFKLSLNKGSRVIRIEEELKRIEAYMKIQNYRFQNRYTLEIQVEDCLKPVYLLTFVLQPLVENAVVHGLEPKPGPGTIRMTGVKAGENMRLQVLDDGVGIADPETLERGYGIRNVRERLRLFYGQEASLRFHNREGGGACAEILIPILSEEKVQAVLQEEQEQREREKR